MCQPSASTAMELNHQPPTISTTIMMAVSHNARRTLRSANGFPASKRGVWQWCSGMSGAYVSHRRRVHSRAVNPPRPVTFADATRTWLRIGLLSFGGPAGQIAVMHLILVEEKRWISERRFLHALSYCMLLPGPEAQQLATYVGWLLHGTRGGLVAGGLFVLPGVIALLALSAVYVAFGSTVAVTALFAGLAPAVLAIVAQAVVRVGKRALNSSALVTIAVLSFLALFLFGVPFPLVVLVAGLAGWALHRWWPGTVPEGTGKEVADDGPPPVIPDDVLHAERPSGRRTLRVLLTGLLVWGVPVALA